MIVGSQTRQTRIPSSPKPTLIRVHQLPILIFVSLNNLGEASTFDGSVPLKTLEAN